MLEIYCCPLAAIDDELNARQRGLLTTAEQEQLANFTRPEPAQAFVASRALLRTVLAEKLRCTPQQVQFTRDANDKPQLVGASLQFNLSHCRDWVALAISDTAVGIDIEHCDRNNNIAGIARRFFQRDEAEWLQSLPENLRAEKFCELWTLKEACVKWSGFGIGRAIAGVGVRVSGNRVTLKLREDFAECGAANAQLYALPNRVRMACIHSGAAQSAVRVVQSIPLIGNDELAMLPIAST